MSSKIRKKIIKITRHSFEGGVEELLDRLKAFGEDWGKRLAGVQTGLVNTIKNAGQELGKIWANLQAMTQSMEYIDMKTMVLNDIMKEVFFRLEVVDKVISGQKPEEVDIEDARVTAEMDYKRIVGETFKKVQIALEEEAKKRHEALEKAKKEAEEAEKAKKEAETAESELKAAETAVETPGGPGADIPEGATVFGG